MGVLSQTSDAIISPLQVIWQRVVESLPGIIGAIIVLIIGSFVAIILGHAVRVILEKLKVDENMKKAHLTRAAGHIHVPAIAGEIVKWYVIILFLQQAVALLSLGALSVLLDSFVRWLPNVIVAAVVVIFGLAIAHFVEVKMVEHTKVRGVKTLSRIIRWVLVVIVGIIALKQIGVDVSILENTFLLIIGALVIGLALAFGISLGLGMKKHSEEMIQEIRKNF